MDKTLMPAAAALDTANLTVLDRTYQAKQASVLRLLVLVIVVALSLLGVLVTVQLFLTRRMHRLLNPLLLLGTVITVLFAGYTIRAIVAGRHHLTLIKQDAFVSMHTLWQARALAYRLNADESRYLLDTAQAQRHETAFRSKVARLANLPAGQSFDSLAAAGPEKLPAQVSGYFIDALHNIAFPAEREAVIATVRTFAAYVAIDQEICRLERNAQHQAASGCARATLPVGPMGFFINLTPQLACNTLRPVPGRATGWSPRESPRLGGRTATRHSERPLHAWGT